MTSQTAPPIIHRLVETFGQNLDAYHFSKNETELRREFLDKFFTALGWDVANEKGYDEAGKEVVHEYSVDISGRQKKADYAFRVGRGDKFDFLVEAKKPSVKIESDPDAAFQIRRYGWSAKLPINILTDFEHFAVYDCRTKPNYGDKASTGRIMLIHYKDYVARWNEIVEIFSPEAVRKGLFAKYVEGMKGKKGTADVDDAFLQEIERWRELLAKNIALRNADIDIAGLNYAVQMTIDRIVFLRICEERGIEPENQLLEIVNRDGIYSELGKLFKRADTKYNSGLFHFKPEKGQNSRPDDLTLSLNIDDKVLKDIIANLYYPKSPYAFLYIPADILGQVYERFLGKVIRLTAGHQAKVEEKPEVRKAGGVYYTPTYIVDYIVKNTVGKLVEGKTPKEVSALKIVDPACGSGTFLLGAYQFLLDWHLNWYVENEPEKAEKNKAIVKVGVGYRLTTAQKKEILLNNIFGVDIDAQAVEVTKLSLLLKVLENASGQLGLGMERVLPDLGNNIKCGNSLIGFDYFEGKLIPDEAERTHINPFDWKNEFKEVFAKGGFDAVIGNPPYGAELSKTDRKYLENIFRAKTTDTAALFMLKAKYITREKGMNGFIVPKPFTYSSNWEEIRRQQLPELTELIDVGKVWREVKLEQVIYILVKNHLTEKYRSLHRSGNEIIYLTDIAKIDCERFGFYLNGITQSELEVSKKIIYGGVFLGNLSINTRGGMFQNQINTKQMGKKVIGGQQIQPYLIDGEKGFIDSDFILPSNAYLKEGAILIQNIVAHIANPIGHIKIIGTIVGLEEANNIVILDTINQITNKSKMSSYFILGLLLSRMINWYVYRFIFAKAIRTMHFDSPVSNRIPIRTINFSNPTDKAQHDKMVSLVKSMLDLHKRLANAQTPQEKERLERQIAVTDKAIDTLVYELYGLTDEEIKIVEDSR